MKHMTDFKEKIEKFLTLKKLAVTGVSSEKPDAANMIYRKFRDSGLMVFPVNPKVHEVEGTTCYPNLSALPVLPDGVVIASPPQSCRPIIDECLKLGIENVWFHRSIGYGSYDREAWEYSEQMGLSVIPAGCPMMYFPPVDMGHRCLKWIFRMTGKIPRT